MIFICQIKSQEKLRATTAAVTLTAFLIYDEHSLEDFKLRNDEKKFTFIRKAKQIAAYQVEREEEREESKKP
ncbi:CLUMA_CG007579, isoform A [Clunio marinus]|uniref:CLUMA_CG007579, isoform A n=1 Tax=Clunio marinus TaxID=568069 RepID=A0A1J1I128_9DIPT|nr:CLUMA_CG007579, isoform A [Clunio marinus]